MSYTIPATGKEMRSLVKKDGTLHLSIGNFPIPGPKAHEVLVRIEATAINPSDVAVVLGFPSLGKSEFVGTNAHPKNPIQIPAPYLPAYKGRMDMPLSAGNEGAGIVVAAGADAQHLLGRVVALFGASSFAEYRCVPAAACMVMNEGTTPLAAAASCVNPFTVLCMIETLKMEGHTAMINTAAASNLGQMLVKACKADGIPLVNIVRREEQVNLLKSIGAEYVCNSSSPDFKKELVAAIAETGATLAFECIGGGEMANDLLIAMEQALLQKATTYSRYGSTTHKQVYIYGGLSQQPTPLTRSYGMAWGVGGWLVTPIIQKVGGAGFQQMKQRIADEIHTTFKSTFYKELSLEEAMLPNNICAYAKAASGEKYYINPMLLEVDKPSLLYYRRDKK